MAKKKKEGQSELFDLDAHESECLEHGDKHSARPQKFLTKQTSIRHLAFGFQNEFNLLGHVADYVDQLPLTAIDRRVETVNGHCEPITISGEIVQSKTVSYNYKLTITPSARFSQNIITSANGKNRFEYEPILHDIRDHPNCIIFRPGPREDLVEKALRRIARRQATSDPRLPVYRAGFTLYQLRKELLRSGHDIRWSDLRDSLHILANTGITLTIMTPDQREVSYQTNFISGLTWGSKAKNSELYDPENSRCFCTLNDIVAYSLITERYQAFQYDLYMRLTTFLSRRILVTLSLEWRNSHIQTGYVRSMNELILRYQSHLSDRLFNDYRLMKRALDELVKMDVLSRYTMEKVVTGKSRARKDYAITMYPTARFVGTQIESIGDRTMREERHSLKRPTMQPLFGEDE